MTNEINLNGVSGMQKIVDFLYNHGLDGSLPYYAANKIKPFNVVNEIVNGKVKYYSEAKLLDYFEWIRNCGIQLVNCTFVDFTWDGGDRHQVIFLPCTKDEKGRMVACFEDKGTWYHILYDESSEKYKFIVYCNFLMLTDAAKTRNKLDVKYIVKPTFL